jgi:uroporphyrinogen decarboxylase
MRGIHFRRVSSVAALLVCFASTASSLNVQRKLVMQGTNPKNDLMIRAARREKVERTPIWIFRQAGRHLPEYSAYKEAQGKNFLELLRSPRDVAECTLQPIRRYNLDAAILFSDILVVAEAFGIKVEMPGGVGILVPEPLSSPSQIALLPRVDVKVKLAHVLESVSLIRTMLLEEGHDIPLIGFSAAPWTLMFYMVGGSSKKKQDIGEKWLVEYPAESAELLHRLTIVVIEYLSAQVEAGAHMLQVFEAMGMMITPASFEKYALPCMVEIATELKRRHPTIPLLVFPRGACYANPSLQAAGYDVVTLDCETSVRATRDALAAAPLSAGGAKAAAIQGNLDPVILRSKQGGNVAAVQAAARSLLLEAGTQNLIANLGEGLRGDEDPALVAALIDAIHNESVTMIKNA